MSDDPHADLWERVYAAFPYERGVVAKEVNRIASKCVLKALGHIGPGLFDQSTFEVHEEQIQAEPLKSLWRYHDRTNLTGRTAPIVVVELDGKRIVIEGTNRVNAWAKTDEPISRLALVLTLRPSLRRPNEEL